MSGVARWAAVALLPALLPAVLAGCGSGDSTVAQTPAGSTSSATEKSSTAAAPEPSPTSSNSPATPRSPDPCAVNLAAPAIAKAVSELPRDPRSKQPWNPEPLAGNYSECTELSAVIIKANTNTENPSTRAVLFHLGQYIPQSVPDTYGFSGIDLAQCTPDTVVLQHAIGARELPGLKGTVKFHWNGTGVEIISNTAG